MARTARTLTNTEVKQAKAKDKEYNLSDGQGLMLRVKPNGSKLWLFNYQHPHTKKRQVISFGAYPAVSLAQARQNRQVNLELLVSNVDPKSHRDEQSCIRQEAAGNTFESVANSWRSVYKSKVKAETEKKTWRSLEADVFPLIGSLPVEQLTALKANSVINGITKRGSLEVARKVARRMNAIMTFAVNTGIVHSNPLVGIKAMIPTSQVKHQPALTPQELPMFMRTLNFADIKRTTRCLIEWQLQTMVRPNEAAGASWSEIDFKNQLWTIPADRMKQPRQDVHVVPLTNQAMALLEVMKPISGNREFIFPAANNPRGHANKQTVNMALIRMGFKGRIVAHGLRSLASTTLNEKGLDYDVIEAALAHVDKDGVRKAYNRTDYLERRRALMSEWSHCIDQASRGQLSLCAANVAQG